MIDQDHHGGEPPERRLNRELIELLNELRVALPGVQVLFAFLLTVPFTSRFAQLSATSRDVFFVAFIASAAASALLVAPSAYHRLSWRRGDKEHMLRVSNDLAIAGLAALAVGIVAVVYLIATLLYGTVAAAGTAAATAGTIGWLWGGIPLARRRRRRAAAPTPRGGRA